MGIRDQILKNANLPSEATKVPEWNGVTVTVRGMTGVQRAEIAELINLGSGSATKKSLDAQLKAIMSCVVDDEGKPIFTEADKNFLAEQSSQLIDRLAEIAFRLSGLNKGAKETAAKN